MCVCVCVCMCVCVHVLCFLIHHFILYTFCGERGDGHTKFTLIIMLIIVNGPLVIKIVLTFLINYNASKLRVLLFFLDFWSHAISTDMYIYLYFITTLLTKI